MNNQKSEQVGLYKAKIALLEAEIKEEQKVRLTELHKELGFESLNDLMKELKNLIGNNGNVHKRGRKKIITNEMKDKIVEQVVQGKKGREIAKSFGLSIASIHKIKKELGLVKKRNSQLEKSAA